MGNKAICCVKGDDPNVSLEPDGSRKGSIRTSNQDKKGGKKREASNNDKELASQMKIDQKDDP